MEQGKDVQQQVTDVHHQMQCLQEEKMRGAAIRARTVWIANQERPCRRFFSLEAAHCKKKNICRLQVNNSVITDQAKIRDAVQSHYTELYQRVTTKKEDYTSLAKHTKQLNETAISELNMDITQEELDRALKSTPRNKAPGPDGLNCEFYRFFWTQLRPILVPLYNEILQRKKLPLSQRKGIITLIPKSNQDDVRESLDGWRPITLLNTDYKLFTKVLANRLKSKVDDVIGPNQKCAVQGRRIADLTQVYNMVYERCSTNGPPAIILQLDQKAAFDCVNHNYMFQVLMEMGVIGPFLNAVHACYYGCSAQVIVNGELTPEIGIYRGVRQGCPLSMLLYIIQLEPILQWITKEQHIEGVRVGQTEFKYGAFADDITLFLTTKQSVRIVCRMWEFVETATGSSLNRQKTYGLWVGNWPDKPMQWLNIQWKTDGIRSLGVWIGNTETQRRNWNTLHQSIQCQMDYWKGRQLSLYGRCVVWNMYIISKYRHRARAASFPLHIRRKIDRMAALFLWHRRYEPTRRSAILYPRKEGGLGATSFLWMVDAMHLELYYRTLQEGEGILRDIIFDSLGLHPMSLPSEAEPPRCRPASTPFAKGIRKLVSQYSTVIEEAIPPPERTAKTIYNRLLISQLPPPKLVIWHGARRAQLLHSRIFRLRALPAIKDILYHIVNDTLATGHWLERKGMVPRYTNPRCVTCTKMEDADHVFIECRRSTQFWTTAALHDITPPPTMKDFLERIATMTSRQLVLYGCAFLALWRERNYCTFKQRDTSGHQRALSSFLSLQTYHDALQDCPTSPSVQ